MSTEKPLEQAVCARCGAAIDPSDSFQVRSDDGEGTAFLCRTEHIVAWVLRGAPWQLERPWDHPEEERNARGAVVLERRRAGLTVTTKFDDLEALRSWASAGGAWGRQPGPDDTQV